MTIDQALAFAVIGGMMAMFVWDKLRYDLVALLGLLIAVACGIVSVEKAFASFSDPVVVIVASVLVISARVGKPNAIGRIIRRLQPYMRTTGRQVLVLTSGVTIMSAFMKNIGALAILLPIAVQVARRSGTAPSKLLMPMAFGSLIGGLVTLVGTSPNILVSRVRSEKIDWSYTTRLLLLTQMSSVASITRAPALKVRSEVRSPSPFSAAGGGSSASAERCGS